MAYAPVGRRQWRWLRPLVGAVLLVGVAWHLGFDSVWAGVHGIGPGALAAGAFLVALCTLCACWRWLAIARAAGLQLGLRDAVSAYYRAQFMNSTLPGGVLGDVDRAVWHARDQRDAARAGGTVAVERVAGQAVQMLIAALVLLIGGARAGLPSVVSALLGIGCLVFGAIAVLVAGLTGVLRELSLRTGLALVAASALAVTGYAAVFLVAAQAVGVQALPQMIPLALVVIVGSAIPLNFAGWGPREGIAAGVFATAGLGAELGLSVAVAYGVICLVAVLPGAVLLLLGRRRRDSAHG
ncbi:MAG: lysylphosphatidylglycerol synthase transmembrane domain-containing protein [Propionibacteriaceae bacterium]|nr:lysylphosphatidylglycerol synthase transmembrane domain-containing protein [Propionibacteriaceae bacterium]